MPEPICIIRRSEQLGLNINVGLLASVLDHPVETTYGFSCRLEDFPLTQRAIDDWLYVYIQEQNSDVFHGFVHVLMNLIRPVQMSSQPASAYDVTTTSRDDVNAANVTTFHLPKDTTKVIHITRCVNDYDDHSNNKQTNKTKFTAWPIR